MLKTNYVSVISKEDLETIALKYVLEINTKKGTYSLHSPNSLKCNINELCQELQMKLFYSLTQLKRKKNFLLQ